MKPNVSMTSLLAAMAVALTATSAGAQTAPPRDRPEYVEPRVYSAEEAVRGVAETGYLPGQFAFVVRGGGRELGRVFLNSQVDYRDPGTLTVVVRGAALDALTEQLGGPPEDRLIGRTVVVDGVALRTRINISEGGRPTDRFYFQAHVAAERADQIHVMPGAPVPIVAPR
ncbi:hypothetical protein ACETK8_00150 [Brevundimonas staleyi]|uniref:Uncharacterized protein n=1 Tax=Brevundimonas staleyi TaxID=74326 RepID=A0ABW0FRV6_9CAUL